MWRRRKSVVIFMLMSLVFVTAPVYAYPGAGAVKRVVSGTTWAAKSTYLVVKYLVVEAFRPVRAITQGLVHLFGVPVEK